MAAARHALLDRVGWDVESRGLYDAPRIEVLIGDEAHATVLTGLQYLGLGRDRVTRIAVDGQGRMRPDALAAALTDAADRPSLVCAQAGNVNTGAFDPLEPIAAEVDRHPNAWLHIDGAFGLWAAVVPALQHLVAGSGSADSWATDAHKWLNVGYDCGFVAVRDREAHRVAMATSAAYLLASDTNRDGWEYVPDSSRRARGFALYATHRSIGRDCVRDLVERCCALARRMADALASVPEARVLNDVSLNQVLVRFGDDDARTREVIRRVQESGEAWMGGTSWQGVAAMRISVSGWQTTEADIDRTAAAILAATRAT
jgi:glutamate/tyrosine decarboxylase-like PLP-dependent enzyme